MWDFLSRPLPYPWRIVGVGVGARMRQKEHKGVTISFVNKMRLPGCNLHSAELTSFNSEEVNEKRPYYSIALPRPILLLFA